MRIYKYFDKSVRSIIFVLMEVFKDVEGFEGRFKVSNYGNVLSINGKYKGEKLLKCPTDNVGYHAVQLRMKPKSKRIRVHQLVAKAFIDNPNNKKCINHKDGIKTNNHIDNLEWVTHAENIKHAVENKLHDLKGENHPNALLDEQGVIEIFYLRKQGLSHQKISDLVGISRRHIGDILNRECWGHLDIPF